jgi:hypothetical protein
MIKLAPIATDDPVEMDPTMSAKVRTESVQKGKR